MGGLERARREVASAREEGEGLVSSGKRGSVWLRWCSLRKEPGHIPDSLVLAATTAAAAELFTTHFLMCFSRVEWTVKGI